MSARQKKLNILIIAALLALAALCYLAFNLGKPKGAELSVSVDGRVICRYSLRADGVYELNGGTNTLVISDGYASVSEADCPDKLCVQHKRISREGECIVCLPNRLTVAVEDAADEVDLVA